MDYDIDAVANRYDNNYAEYTRYRSQADPDKLELWQPIIWGCMLGKSLKDFLTRVDCDKPIGQELIEPICGEMPDEIKLICYHAKRLSKELIDSELPIDAERQYNKTRRELLYGQDPLSVIEMLEVEL